MTAKNTLVLPANLQIANVTEWRAKVLQALETGKDVTLKAQETVRIDTAGLQLLLALQRGVQQKGKRLKWENVNDELEKCIALLGAKSLLIVSANSPAR